MIALIVLLAMAPAASHAAVVRPSEDVVPLPGQVEIFHDPSGAVTLETLLAHGDRFRFRPNTGAVANFGYVKGHLWLRFRLALAGGPHRYLLADHPVSGDLAIFPVTREGRLAPEYVTRVRGYRAPAWKLNIPAGQTVDILLRASAGNEVLRLPLLLMTEDAFFRHALGDYLFFGMVQAGLLTLLIYSLVLAIGVKTPSYRMLSVFLATLLLILNRDSNLFPALTFLNDSRSGFYPTALVAVTLAALRYFSLINPGAGTALERLLKRLQWLLVLVLPFAWLLSTRWLYGFVLLMVPVLIALTFQEARRNRAGAREAYIASLIFMVAVGFYLLTHTGWITSIELNRLFVQIGQAGSLIAVVFLSVSQATESRLLLATVEEERIRNQVKDQFLATMSHELRTPMNAVISAGALLRQTSLDDEQQQYLGRLDTASQHMMGLINDILDLSRLQSGNVSLNEECFFLPRMLEDLDSMVAGEAEARGLDLRIVCDEAKRHCVLGDRQRLHQVLLNLLFNAIKFTPRGRISLEVSHSPDQRNETYAFFRFVVRDSGIGIAPELQQRIFEPFAQAESDRDRHHGGAGLGLAISRQLVELMGGTLALESEPGKGSRFHFTLRLPVCSCVAPDVADSASGDARSGALEGRRVMLVEDDRLNRFLVEQLLRKEGIEVITAESGEQALQTLQTRKDIELILMDISMPGMDGYETTRRIHTDLGLSEIPVVALTAHAVAGERRRCLDAGMCEYLTKPVDIETLRGALKSWIPRADTQST